MKQSQRFLLVLLLLAYQAVGQVEGFEWKTASPESQGLSSDKLEELTNNLKDRAHGGQRTLYVGTKYG